MDDQATLSHVYPEVIEDLAINEKDQSPVYQTTTTIHGTHPQYHTNIRGLLIHPLTEDTPIPLENALTQKLPNLAENIPTPEEVASIPGLSHLSTKFPQKQNWPTVLLIGRDCMQVHTQSHPTWSSDNRQLAAKTPLGWVVMGRPAHHTSPLSKDTQKQPHISKM